MTSSTEILCTETVDFSGRNCRHQNYHSHFMEVNLNSFEVSNIHHPPSVKVYEKCVRNCMLFAVWSIQKNTFFGVLNAHVPIILSHLQENLQENVQDILNFCLHSLLVIDAVTDANSRLEPYNMIESALDTVIVSSNVVWT